MHRQRWLPGNSLLWLLLVGLAVAYVTPIQAVGYNQAAHYAAVRSLSEGRPSLGRYHVLSGDVSYIGGRYYAAKAPGLAILSLPEYAVLHALHLMPANASLDNVYPAVDRNTIHRWTIWLLHLWTIVPAALALAFLLYRAAERLQPQTGIAVAGVAGLGTLLFPFATEYFAHVLSAALGFGAFALLLLRSPNLPASRRRLLLAGLLAGLAIMVEFTLGLVAVALALYVASEAPRLRRLGTYLSGLAVGLVPLGLFNTWAFGSPFRLSYENAVIRTGSNGHQVLGANSKGFFGVGVPHLRTLMALLFSPRGLLILSPVLVLALVGIVLLYQRGDRREAWLIGGVVAAFLAFNSGYAVPFGGQSPGPRFLIPAIPFAALALAPALHRLPLSALVLGAISIGAMLIATASEPLLSNNDTDYWLARWRKLSFTTSVVPPGDGHHSWLAVVPLFAAVAVVGCGMLVSLRPHLVCLDLVPSLALPVSWLLMLRVDPELLHVGAHMRSRWGLFALVLLVVTLAYLLLPARPVTVLAAPPLAALTVPGVMGHTTISLVLVLVVLLSVFLVEHHGKIERFVWQGRLR